MDEIITNVNWLPVIVGFVVSFLAGWVWYLPSLPIGRRWMEGVGLDPKAPGKMSMAGMVWQLVGTFLLAWLVGITAANNALLTIILVGLTIVSLLVAAGQYTGKSSFASAVEGGFIILMLVIMIVCQGIW